MRIVLLAALFLTGLGGMSAALEDPGYFRPNPYQERFCAGLTPHFRSTNGARVDCSDGRHAIVVEYQDYWPEAIGQALAFAADAGLEPGIILVCRNDGQHCASAAAHIEATMETFGVPYALWSCGLTDASLGDCKKLR